MRVSFSTALVAGLVLWLSAAASPVLAQDARYLAGNCANCHGTDGRSAGGALSGLAGLPRTYFIEQMNAFRSGARQASIMHQIAKGYSEDQISRLADYFSQIKPSR